MRSSTLLFALALAACALPALGDGSPVKAHGSALRTFEKTIQEYHAGSVNGLGAAGTAVETATIAYTAGLNGVLARIDMNAATSFVISSTSTFVYPPPYPAKLFISIIDASASAANCEAGGVIYGIDQFGQEFKETLPFINPLDGYQTTHVFERLTAYYPGSGNCGSGGSGDYLHIAVSTAIGLPYPIRSIRDIQQICQYDAPHDVPGAGVGHCIQSTTTNGGTTAQTGVTFDSAAQSLDFATAETALGKGRLHHSLMTYRGRASTY